jgi:phospholipase A1
MYLVLQGTVLLLAGGNAADAEEERTLADCAAIENDAQRLGCYDVLSGRRPSTLTVEEQPVVSPQETSAASEPPAAIVQEGPPAKHLSALSRHWELDSESKQGTFLLRPHEPNYLLIGKYSTNPNPQPASPTRGESLPQDLDGAEASFQISLKVKAAEGLFAGHADLWFAYTQQSFWQVYNARNSRPFRETNYEPEAMLLFPTNYSLLGLKGRFINLGLLHQSDGQSGSLSRSWNRIYAQFAFERGDFALLVRPWYRLPEHAPSDDNPDIQDYMGHGDLVAVYKRGDQTFSILLRNFLRSDYRGTVELGYSFPLAGRLKGYLQLFNGYGQSLLDYNHNQTTIGIGLMLTDWM